MPAEGAALATEVHLTTGKSVGISGCLVLHKHVVVFAVEVPPLRADVDVGCVLSCLSNYYLLSSESILLNEDANSMIYSIKQQRVYTFR